MRGEAGRENESAVEKIRVAVEKMRGKKTKALEREVGGWAP